VRLFSYQTFYRVQNNWRTEQYCSEHRQELCIETGAAINNSGDAAVNQQHSTSQCPQQGHTYSNLLAVSMFGGNVLFKMQMLMSHNMVSRFLCGVM